MLGWRIGLYRGFWATVLRDTPSFVRRGPRVCAATSPRVYALRCMGLPLQTNQGAWFATYELMKALVLRHVDVEKNRAAHYAGVCRGAAWCKHLLRRVCA